MSSHVLVHFPQDGSSCVVTTPDDAYWAQLSEQGLSLAQAADSLASKMLAADIVNASEDYILKHTIDLPADKQYYDAWTIDPNTGVVSEDLPRSRTLHRGEIARKLADMRTKIRDQVEYATDLGDTTEVSRLHNRREAAVTRYMGVHAEIDAIANLESLREFWPSEIDR